MEGRLSRNSPIPKSAVARVRAARKGESGVGREGEERGGEREERGK